MIKLFQAYLLDLLTVITPKVSPTVRFSVERWYRVSGKPLQGGLRYVLTQHTAYYELTDVRVIFEDE